MQKKKSFFLKLFTVVSMLLTPFTGVSAESDNVLRMAHPSEMSIFDPALYNDITTSDVIGQTMEGLYRVSGTNEVELGQAESVELSDDETVYTFKLRDDVYWSNGDPVTAQDFEFAFKRVIDPSSGSQASNEVEIIKNAHEIRQGEMDADELAVKAIDDKTLEIELTRPAPYFKDILTLTRFMPINHKFYEEVGDEYGTSYDKVVYNGPFVLENWTGTETEWNLVKNDKYWDADNVSLDGVEFSVIKEVGTGANLFDAGEIDYISLTSDYIPQYEGSPELHAAPKSTVGYLSFNMTREETANPNLRRAISQAINREEYAEQVIKDGSTPLYGQVPAKYAINSKDEDYRDLAGNVVEYDLEVAQADWQKAKEELGVEEIELELLTSDVELSRRTSEYLQEQLQNNLPGLTITIRSVPLKNRIEIQKDLDYDIFYATWAPGYADALHMLEQYETGAPINFAKYENEEYDALIEKARNELAGDEDARWEALMEAEKLGMYEDPVTAPLYQVANTYLLSENVEGFIIQPYNRTFELRQVKLN